MSQRIHYPAQIDRTVNDVISRVLEEASTHFGTLSVETPRDQISVNFLGAIPDDVVNVGESNGGSVSVSGPQATLSTSTAVDGSAQIQSRQKTRYLPGHELRVAFTAGFTTGEAGCAQRAGLFDENDGFWVGFNGADFVCSRRYGGTDHLATRDTWDDALDGSASSKFTRNGSPEAIDFEMVNVFRIRFGWLGNSDITFEVKAPDGHYVTFYRIRFPNSSTLPSIENPNLPMTFEAIKTSGSADFSMRTSSWNAAIMESGNSGRVSEGNSTLTPLIADAVFLGSAEDILNAGQVSISVYSDVDSAAGGLKFEYSHDNVSWHVANSYTYAAESFRQFQYGVNARFFRVRFINGSSAQSSFELQTILLKTDSKLTIHRVEDEISGDTSAELTKTVVTGKLPSGNYGNVPIGGLDPNNSTQTPLLASETYTGAFQDVRGYSSALIFLISDQPLSTAKIVWSNDGVSARSGLLTESSLLTSVTELGGFYIYLSTLTTMVDDYYRVELQMDSVDSTIMELDSWLYEDPFPGSFIGLEDTLSSLSIAQLNRSVVAGTRPDGTFANARVGGEDPANSTEDLLVAAATFTGEWVETTGYIATAVTINSDQPSATNGLKIQFSEDQATVTKQATFTYNSEGGNDESGRFFAVPVQGQYYRVVYQNGGNGQNVFSIHTQLEINPLQTPISHVNAPIPEDANAERTQAILSAENTDSEFKNVLSDIDQNLHVNVQKATDTEFPMQASSEWTANQVNISSATATQVLGTPLEGRKELVVKNLAAEAKVYIGPNSNVDENSRSLEIAAQQSVVLPLSDQAATWMIAEDIGTVTNTSTRSGASTATSGSPTNAGNVLTSDDARASLNADGDAVEVSGYTNQGIYPEVDTIKLGFEGRKESGQDETVTHQETENNTNGSNSTSMTITDIAEGSDDLYFAALGSDSSGVYVSSVNGLGLSWSEPTGSPVTVPSSQGHLSVFVASGSGAAGSVTMNYNGTISDSSGTVTRISGADISGTPTGTPSTATGFSANPNISGIATDAGDKVMVFVFTENRDPSGTPAGYTGLASPRTADSGIAVYIQSTESSGGTESFSMNLGGNADWAIWAVAVKQAPALDPEVVLSYELSGSPGATSLTQSISNESDDSYEVDITGDEAWEVTDVANITVIITGNDIGNAAAEIDHVYIELTETETGGTVRVSLLEFN